MFPRRVSHLGHSTFAEVAVLSPSVVRDQILLLRQMTVAKVSHSLFLPDDGHSIPGWCATRKKSPFFAVARRDPCLLGVDPYDSPSRPLLTLVAFLFVVYKSQCVDDDGGGDDDDDDDDDDEGLCTSSTSPILIS